MQCSAVQCTVQCSVRELGKRHQLLHKHSRLYNHGNIYNYLAREYRSAHLYSAVQCSGTVQWTECIDHSTEIVHPTN